jgi:hypothetical protein
VVIFKDAGAYGFVMSSIYNGRPQPAEIAIRNDNIIFIRKRMSPEEMIVQHF